jgi:hypothetical protein
VPLLSTWISPLSMSGLAPLPKAQAPGRFFWPCFWQRYCMISVSSTFSWLRSKLYIHPYSRECSRIPIKYPPTYIGMDVARCLNRDTGSWFVLTTFCRQLYQSEGFNRWPKVQIAVYGSILGVYRPSVPSIPGEMG